MSNSTQPTSNSTKTCVTGSTRDLVWPVPEPEIWWQDTYVAIAGNDTTVKPFVDCCAPYVVQFLPPCIIWCHTGTKSMTETEQCWNKSGLAVGDRFGVMGNVEMLTQEEYEARMLKPGHIAGMAIGSAAVLALVAWLVFLFCGRTWRRAAEQNAAIIHALTRECEQHGVVYGVDGDGNEIHGAKNEAAIVTGQEVADEPRRS